jgi:vacuolar-type H+-ATPase subunit I/STV1
VKAIERLLMRLNEVNKLIDDSPLKYAEDSSEFLLEDYVEFDGFDNEEEIKGYKAKYNKAKELIQKLAKYAQEVEKKHDETVDSVGDIQEAVANALYDYEVAKSIGE